MKYFNNRIISLLLLTVFQGGLEKINKIGKDKL